MSNESDNSKTPTSDEGHKIEGHSYDGIDELDNALPNWWINSFYLTIIFALGYFYYYNFADGPTLVQEYEHAKGDYEIAQSLQKGSIKLASDDEMLAFSKNPARVKAGRELYQGKCLACHGALGQGGIGPNLTDNYWIHGGKLTEIYTTISNGVLDKGMPPWGQVLKQDEIYSLVAFIKSIAGSNPAGAKAPQGQVYKE